MEGDNIERTRAAFAAFLSKDALVIGRLIDDDTVWRVPGHSRMGGEYRGREQIFAFLRRTGELTEGTYRADLRFVAGNGDHVVALYRATGRRGAKRLDIDQLLVFRYRDGAWAEVQAVPVDQYAFDDFWS